MLRLLCPDDDCLTAVEEGPSRVASRLLSLAPNKFVDRKSTRLNSSHPV